MPVLQLTDSQPHVEGEPEQQPQPHEEGEYREATEDGEAQTMLQEQPESAQNPTLDPTPELRLHLRGRRGAGL